MARDKQKRYLSFYNYRKRSIKRIPLDVLNDYYNYVLLPAVKESGETVNGFIKKAIAMRLGLTDEEVEEIMKSGAASEEAEEASETEEEN